MNKTWKDDYIDMLGCDNPKDLQIEKAFLLKLENMPRFLYKYRPFNKHSIDNLKNNTVWLSSPSKYNDPFECIEHTELRKIYGKEHFKNEGKSDLINYGFSEEMIEKLIESDDPLKTLLLSLQNVSTNSKKQKNQATKSLVSILEKHFTQSFSEKNDFMQKTMKLCSFCESPSNILMWSHYANNHKGFCVEYDFAKYMKDDIRLRLLHPVIYKKQLYDSTVHLRQSLYGNQFNNLYPIISCSTKYSDWKYEKEWRMLFNIGTSFKEQNYSMNNETKVYIGLRMSKRNQNVIVKICKDIGIPVFIANKSIHKYGLDFEKII